MRDKIRFLATGDIHSDIEFLNEIDKKVDFNTIDFIILIGDISDKPNDFKNIFETFKNKQVFMVPGNHDTKKKLDALTKHYGVHLIGNAPVKINDKIGIFGTNYIDMGFSNVHDRFILENLIKNYMAIKNTKFKIHLSHLPPAKTKVANMSPFYPMIQGSIIQKKFLENFSPDLTLVGHIHESSGLEEMVNKTKVVNVGKTYKIFEIEL